MFESLVSHKSILPFPDRCRLYPCESHDQKIPFSPLQLEFAKFDHETASSHSVFHVLNLFCTLCYGAEHHYVILLYADKMQTSYHILHFTWGCQGSTHQTEWHHLKLKNFKPTNKRGLLFTLPASPYLPILREQVESPEEGSARQFIKYFLNFW